MKAQVHTPQQIPLQRPPHNCTGHVGRRVYLCLRISQSMSSTSWKIKRSTYRLQSRCRLWDIPGILFSWHKVMAVPSITERSFEVISHGKLDFQEDEHLDYAWDRHHKPVNICSFQNNLCINWKNNWKYQSRKIIFVLWTKMIILSSIGVYIGKAKICTLRLTCVSIINFRMTKISKLNRTWI
jgi:hypothetical protein